MAVKCVNIQHESFKTLAKAVGFGMAKSLTASNDYNIPTVDEAISMIRANKVKQFKSAISYIRTLKSPTVEDLLKGLNGIVREYNGSYYVVNGARIAETPAPVAAAEVEQANVKFLEALNDTFGNIFVLSGKPGVATGLKLITGSEQIKDGVSLPTKYDESNLTGTVVDDVASYRNANMTMASAYLRNAQWFAEGFIPGPPSMKNNVKLPYANKAIATRLAKLREDFNKLGTSKADKAKKETIKERMFKLSDTAFQEFKDAIKKNLNAIFDAWDTRLIDRSRHWYDGANRVAQNFASTYGLPHEAAGGILAVLSPQNEWFNNISAADRVMDIMRNHLTTKVSSSMFDNAIHLSKGEPFEQVVRAMKEQFTDKSIGDILTLAENDTVFNDIAANMLRVVDLSVHGPEVIVVTPEGVASGIKTDVGGLVRFAWGSTSEIFKAISIFQNPSIENISEKIGKGSKVRNFYNNIVNPNSELGHVTVDTHAMGAAFLNVISSEEASAMNLFRSGGSPIYSLIKEAYQEVAQEKGLRPREVQSITWEAIRLLIKESDKTEANREEINQIWQQVQNKKLSHEQAINDIIGRFQFGRPQWDRATVSRGNSEGMRAVKSAVQQGNSDGDNLRGQQPTPGTDFTGLAERTVEENEALLSEIESKASDAGYKATIQAARDANDIAAGVQYFVDKAVENPDKFDRDFGETFTDKMIALASDEQINAALQSLQSIDPENASIPVLEKILQEREKLSVNKTKATQDFFSDVVSGKSEKFKPKKEWVSILPFSNKELDFKKVYDTFKGNFDSHIAASIPTFRETQIKVGAVLSDIYKDGALIYDIGGSEGGFVKAITRTSNGKIKSINLDVNEEMEKAHNAKPVEGSTYVKEAFFESYTDDDSGITYPRHIPTEKADVVHESMVFQFISPERKQFISEIKKNYIKKNGIVLLEEKVLPATEEEWKRNEQKKDGYKLQYFPQEAITEKAEQVLVGMKANQTAEKDLVYNLKTNFKVVQAYWDSGNFKGYIASDSQEAVDTFISKIGGKITSQYSSNNTTVANREVRQVTGKEYYDAISKVLVNRPTDSVQLTPNGVEYYEDIVAQGGKLFLAEDGTFGGYVTNDGYMGGLFKDPSVKDKVTKALQELRIANGGYYMDAYSTLEKGYVANGFRPIARLPFNESVAPSNWKDTVLKSKPDVVFFAYNPNGEYSEGDGKIVDSYEEGLEEAKKYKASEQPTAVKVTIDEQVLADMTEANQEQTVEEPLGWRPVDVGIEFQKINEEQFSREQKMRFSLNNVINMLKTKFGVKVRVVNEPGSFWRGKYSKGVITINEAYVSPDTPFHEVLHPFIDVIKKDNPELYNALLEEVKNSEEGKSEFEYVKNAYSELNEDEQWDEVLVQRLGRMSARQYLAKEETKNLFDRFVDWIKTTLAKLGIMTQDFRTNMSLEEFADLIVNPSFVFDLNRKMDFENNAERFSKLSNNFDDVINVVRQKLQADAASRTKDMSEDTARRKFFSGKTADALTADPRDLKAIDNFILSSAANLKKLNEKFQEFKDQFDAKGAKSADDLAKLSKLLNEIEDCVTLYEDVDLLINAVMDEFPDAEDSIGNLKKNYRREAALINDYKSYAKELIVNWLMPHASSAINKALATGKPFTIVSKATYEAVQKELQGKGITDKRTILETAFKRELASYITTAKKDASAVTQFLGPILHSRDPLSALIGRAIVEEYTSALKKGLNIQEKLVKLVRQARGLPVFNTNKDHFDFYAKYMRQANSYEYKGINDKGEPEYEYVKRWAFHEEYKWDEFYKSKREMEKKIGPAPSKNDIPKYDAWKKARDAWYAANTVQTTDGYVPSGQYRNAEFTALQNDKLFVELYKAYKDANTKAGRAGLKYGIIPQNTYTNIKAEKGKVAQTAIEKLRLFIGEDDQVYFSQKNNLKEKKTVPLAFTRMVDEKDLSFDLLQSVAKYAVSAEKYNSISQIEPHVNVLKNFIGGNASLAIDSRQVVKITANGLKALSKAERKAMQVEATRINEQLDAFLNDVIYGQPMKKAAIQLFNSKFRVEDKNGNVHIIKGFSDMAEYIGIHDLDYHGFEVGKERQLKDYKVTMLRKDWNWSVKKGANTLGLITAFQQLALNPVAGMINILRAKLETFIEGAGGRYFTIGDALKAEGIYFKALGSGDFFEDLKGGKPSFLSDMLIEYDGIQGELYNELGKKISGSLANKLFRRNHLFFMQQGGEHYVQTQMMIAMMLHQKVQLKNGETISLFEAKQREYNGQLKMSDTTWTEQNDADFRQNVKFVNTNMHGNYNKLDKAMLQRTWWGSLLMMFRKHIYTGFASRYRSGYVNHQTGNYTEGYYRTFFFGLVNQMKSLIEQKRMGQLSEDERYAFRKIAADFAALTLLMFAFKAFDDDDDDEEFNDYMALISRRLISEGVQYTPVIGTLDLAKVVTNPAASVSTVDKVWDALSQSISDPTAEYERSGPGYQQGQNKAAVKWGRAIPVYRQYINTVEPERLLQFYGKNSIWFLKPSAKKGEEGEQ